MNAKSRLLKLLIVLEVILLVIVVVGSVLVNGNILPSREDVVRDDINVTVEEEPNDDFATESVVEDTEIQAPVEENTTEQIENVELPVATFSPEVEAKIASMTLEEKVAQIFMTTPEELTGVDDVTIAGNGTKTAYEEIPVGALVYSERNFQGKNQTKLMMSNMQNIARESVGVDLILCVSEIGGANNSPLARTNGYSTVDSPAAIAEGADVISATVASIDMSDYLNRELFNMTLAPIADLSAGVDAAYDETTYGSDAAIASAMVSASVAAFHENGIKTTTGIFPGKAMGTTMSKDLIQWEAEDLLAYKAAVEQSTDMMMVGNIYFESLTGDSSVFCSQSKKVAAYIRNEMGYAGVLVTEELTGEAVVSAINAGMNMIYCQENFKDTYQMVLQAVNNGEIDENTINQSVGYILSLKM